jgi:hypothetical protein
VSLRDQLARKRARTSSFPFAVDEEGARTLVEYQKAERALDYAKMVQKGVDRAQEQVDALAPQLRDHCQQITFRGLTEDERDALVSEHTVPETDAKLLEKDPAATRIERAGFLADALAATVLDEGNLTADEWLAELSSDRWTAGDLAALFERVVQTTGEQPARSIPFD